MERIPIVLVPFLILLSVDFSVFVTSMGTWLEELCVTMDFPCILASASFAGSLFVYDISFTGTVLELEASFARYLFMYETSLIVWCLFFGEVASILACFSATPWAEAWPSDSAH